MIEKWFVIVSLTLEIVAVLYVLAWLAWYLL